MIAEALKASCSAPEHYKTNMKVQYADPESKYWPVIVIYVAFGCCVVITILVVNKITKIKYGKNVQSKMKPLTKSTQAQAANKVSDSV